MARFTGWTQPYQSNWTLTKAGSGQLVVLDVAIRHMPGPIHVYVNRGDQGTTHGVIHTFTAPGTQSVPVTLPAGSLGLIFKTEREGYADFDAAFSGESGGGNPLAPTTGADPLAGIRNFWNGGVANKAILVGGIYIGARALMGRRGLL